MLFAVALVSMIVLSAVLLVGLVAARSAAGRRLEMSVRDYDEPAGARPAWFDETARAA
jgi:hypothetical protein